MAYLRFAHFDPSKPQIGTSRGGSVRPPAQ